MSDLPVLVQPTAETASSAKPAPSFHEQLLDSLYDGVYFVDRDRRITYWNKGAEQLTGYSSGEIVGRYCFDNLLMHVDEEGVSLCGERCPLAMTMIDGKRREADVYLRHKFGYRVPICVRASPIFDGTGCIIGAAEVFSDVTARKNMERRAGELEKLAFVDALTGLPNRRYVELKLEQALQEAERFGRNVGLLMIDVDHFKQVNDTYGHETGDIALRTVSKTLSKCVRPGDTVGRWGGEEFLVLVMGVGAKALSRLAERCRKLIASSAVRANDRSLQITASVGATLVRPADSAESAITRADELMYKSKLAGRNRTTSG